MPVSHVFSCTIADDAGAAAAGEVLPSHWNSVHSLSLATNEVIKFVSAGTQSVSSGTIVFANSNGVTFGMSGSSQITASHNGLTTAALSDHSHGNPTLALTNLSGTTASASNGLTLSLSAASPGGGIAAAAGTQTEGGCATQDLYAWGDFRKNGYRCAIDCGVLVGHYDVQNDVTW